MHASLRGFRVVVVTMLRVETASWSNHALAQLLPSCFSPSSWGQLLMLAVDTEFAFCKCAVCSEARLLMWLPPHGRRGGLKLALLSCFSL